MTRNSLQPSGFGILGSGNNNGSCKGGSSTWCLRPTDTSNMVSRIAEFFRDIQLSWRSWVSFEFPNHQQNSKDSFPVICSSCSGGFSCPLTGFLGERMSICALIVCWESRSTIKSWRCRTLPIIYLKWSEKSFESIFHSQSSSCEDTYHSTHYTCSFGQLLPTHPWNHSCSSSVFTARRFLQIVITSIKIHNTELQARKTLSWPCRAACGLWNDSKPTQRQESQKVKGKEGQGNKSLDNCELHTEKSPVRESQ